VKADRSRIAQVFTNLLTNSINYGKKDGTTVVRFYPMDKVIMVEVSDDGPGIDESVLPRLFERFYRVEQSRDRNSGGSGLGLAIVKHIIETQHNQTINVRSTVEVGSTFYIGERKKQEQII
jgi:two-component system phosphate regulon sensor histidine kinase PhoR